MCSDVEFRLQYYDLCHCTFDTAEAAIDALKTCPPHGYADKETAQAVLKKGTIKWTNTVFSAAQTLNRMAKVGLSMLCLLELCALNHKEF